jgi:resuscitation-promoting factor RpfB
VHRNASTVHTDSVRVPRRRDHSGAAYRQTVPPAGNAPTIDLVALQYEPPSIRSGAILQGAVRVLLALGLAAGCALYLQAQKQVTVVDRGQARGFKTFAPTVGSALSRLGVEVGPADRVIPNRSTRLLPNQRIEVLRPKKVVVVINGTRRVEEVTGRTVDEILKELSVVSRGALIAPAPSSRIGVGEEIVVAQSVSTTVVHDGHTRPVLTNVLTAGGLLRQLGVVLGPHDRVEPSIVAYPSEGSTIKVVRVNQALEKLHSKIGFKRVTEQSDKLELGVRKIKTKGVEGIKASTYRITYEDGKVKSRIFVGSEVVREPVGEITLVGSYRPTVKNPTHSQTGKATWYTQPGLMAAHRSLPFGTLVRVTNMANGRQVTVTIRDRGPYADGRIIDLSDAAFTQLSPQSRGVLNVKIEW